MTRQLPADGLHAPLQFLRAGRPACRWWPVSAQTFTRRVVGFLARVAWTFIRGGWGLIP